MMETHDVELILTFFILNVLVDFLEAARERAPSFCGWAMPYQDVTLIRGRGDRGFMWMPLYLNKREYLIMRRMVNLHGHGEEALDLRPTH